MMRRLAINWFAFKLWLKRYTNTHRPGTGVLFAVTFPPRAQRLADCKFLSSLRLDDISQILLLLENAR
jgi:hypothetical protein